MTASPVPSILTAFASHLDGKQYKPESRKGLLSGLRRIIRDLDAEDMTSEPLLALYRAQLKPGTRNVCDLTWANLTEMLAPGIVLPKGGLPPRQALVHPLYSSLTLLSVLAPDYERLSELRWSDLMASPQASNLVTVTAARRVWDYQTAVSIDGAYTAPEPRITDTLVPVAVDRRPMHPWLLRVIVNSRQSSGDRTVIGVLAELEERLCGLGMGGTELRTLHEPFEAQREKLLRSTTALDGLRKALEATKRNDLGLARHVLQHWVRLGRSG